MCYEEFLKRKQKLEQQLTSQINEFKAKGYSESEIELFTVMLAMDRPCPYAREMDNEDICGIDYTHCHNLVLRYVIFGHWCDTKQISDFEINGLAMKSNEALKIGKA